MFVHGFLAGRYVARALRADEPPAKLAMIARGADSDVRVVPLVTAQSLAPSMDACIQAVAQFESRGNEAASGVLFDRGRVFVCMPPSVGDIVLVCAFDSDGALADLQVGQRGEPRDADELTEGFREGLSADSDGDEELAAEDGRDARDFVHELGRVAGTALADALAALAHGTAPFAQAYGTAIVRKQGEATFTVPALQDERKQALASWLAQVQPAQLALLQLQDNGVLTIKVMPHDFTIAFKVTVVDGAPRTSPPGFVEGATYDGTAETFLDGIDAGIASHSAAGFVEPGYGMLPAPTA